MKKIVVEIIAALLVLFFTYVSISKFLDMKTFEGDINNQPFPNSLTPYLVWGLPIFEVAGVLALLFDKTRMAGFIGFLVLLSLFAVYTTLVLLKFFDYVPCSCGGLIKSITWNQHFALNLFLLVITATGIILHRRRTPKIANAVQQ